MGPSESPVFSHTVEGGGGEAKEKRESCMTVTVTSVWTVDTITSFAWLLSFSSVWPGPSQCNCHLLISPSGEVLLMTVLWVKHMQECLTCCLMVLFIGMLVQFCMMFCSHTHLYVCTKRLKLLFLKAQFTDWVINDIDVCVLLCRTFIQTYIWKATSVIVKQLFCCVSFNNTDSHILYYF